MVSVIIVVYNKYIINNLTYIIGIQVKLTNCTLRLVLYYSSKSIVGFPDSSVGKESVCQSRRHRFYPWVGKIPWRWEWKPTPVFLSGKCHGQRSLEGYSPWGHKE